MTTSRSTNKQPRRTAELMTKLRIKIVVGAIVAAILLGYAYYRTHDLIIGPQITIDTPENGATAEQSSLPIRGTVRNVAQLTLNGKTIAVDESGAFQEHVLLSYGYNILEVAGQDRFGRTTEKTLELIYK